MVKEACTLCREGLWKIDVDIQGNYLYNIHAKKEQLISKKNDFTYKVETPWVYFLYAVMDKEDEIAHEINEGIEFHSLENS